MAKENPKRFKVDYTVPTSRQDINSGDELSVIVGKIAKIQDDLKTVAYSGKYSDLSGKPTIDTALSSSSTNAVQNKVINSALSGKASTGHNHDTSYLKLTGGTLNTSSFYGVNVKRTDTNGSAISYKNSEGSLGGIGFLSSGELAISSGDTTNGNILKASTTEAKFPKKVTAETFSGALSGNATTATKLATSKELNGISFDGTSNERIPISTAWIDGGGNSAYDAKPWFKIASTSTTKTHEDIGATFFVKNTWGYSSGILNIRCRIETTAGVFGSPLTLHWLLADTGVNLDNFVLVCIENSTTGIATIELWCKPNFAYDAYAFVLLDESNRTPGKNVNSWILHYPAIRAASYTNGTHIIMSTLRTIKNSVGIADKWKTSRNINGMSIDGGYNRVNYGKCSTAAGTVAKIVDCEGFALITGAEIAVKFTVTNTAGSPTLNVNNTGAKPIYYRGSAINAGYLAANRTYTFRYNGTQYDLVGDIDTNTTYSNFVKSGSGAKSGLVPAPSTTAGNTKYLREDGTWQIPPNNTYSNMTGASSSTNGKSGLVPAPTSGKQTSFLRGDGTWVIPTDTKYTHPSHTAYESGLYKIKTDNLGHVTAATKVVKADITALGIPASDTNTHYASKNVVGSATATSNTTTALTNGNVYINSVENNAVTSSHKISGTGATTVTTNTSGQIIINSTDTKYTHPTTAGNKHIPAGGASGQCLKWKSDGTVEWAYLAYLPSSGGTLSGTLNFSNANSMITWNNGTYQQRIKTTDDSNVNTAVFSFQQSPDSGSTFTDLMTIKDNGQVVANSFVGSLSGNASSATKLVTARKLNGVSFDGTSDVRIAIPTTAVVCDGAGWDSTPWFKIASARTTQTHSDMEALFLVKNTYGNSTGILQIRFRTEEDVGVFGPTRQLTWLLADTIVNTDHFVAVGIEDKTNGVATVELWCNIGSRYNAYSFVLLNESNRWGLNIGGWTLYSGLDGKGSASYTTGTYTVTSTLRTIKNPISSIDAGIISSGTLNAARLATSGVTAASYGPSANVSPTHSGTFSVPYITVDKYGRVTAASTKTITLPASGNTDTKVTQNKSTSANFRPLLLGYNDNADASKVVTMGSPTNVTYMADGLYCKPNEGKLYANSFISKNEIIMKGHTVPYTTNGATGYYCALQIKVTNTYLDTPIEVVISDRVGTCTTTYSIRFDNQNSTDPTINAFKYRGYYMEAHLCKSATSTWQLWICTDASYSAITVHSIKSGYIYKCAVSFPDTYMSETNFNAAIASGGSLTNEVTPTLDANYRVGHADSATRWTTPRVINGMTVNGQSNAVNYGTCSTAAGTVAKTVACTDFKLITGAEITVKFTVTNTAASPTLNVNSTGAKPIYYRGAAISAGSLVANRTYTFRYNGTQYEFVGDINTDSYLPLTGGTLNINSFYGLNLKRTDAYGAAIAYKNSNGDLGGMGFSEAGDFVVSSKSNTNGNILKASTTNAIFPNKVTAKTFDGAINVDRVTKSCNALPAVNQAIIEEYNKGSTYNLPTDAFYHIMSIKGKDENYGTQLALGMTAAGVYYRNYNNSAWGTWKSLVNTDTDTKVSQTATSTNANYEVLFSSTADNTTRTEGARKSSQLTFNPSTKTLTAAKFNGNATSATKVYGTLTNPDFGSTTSYCIPFYNGTANGNKSLCQNDGITVTTSNGTNSLNGATRLELGNTVASGTAGNKRGLIRLHANNGHFVTLDTVDYTTVNITQVFPEAFGAVTISKLIYDGSTDTSETPHTSANLNTLEAKFFDSLLIELQYGNYKCFVRSEINKNTGGIGISGGVVGHGAAYSGTNKDCHLSAVMVVTTWKDAERVCNVSVTSSTSQIVGSSSGVARESQVSTACQITHIWGQKMSET